MFLSQLALHVIIRVTILATLEHLAGRNMLQEKKVNEWGKGITGNFGGGIGACWGGWRWSSSCQAYWILFQFFCLPHHLISLDLYQLLKFSWYRCEETHKSSRSLSRGKGKYFPLPLSGLLITPSHVYVFLWHICMCHIAVAHSCVTLQWGKELAVRYMDLYT